MEIVIDRPHEDVLYIFKNKIVYNETPPERKIGLFQQEQFIGNITGNKIWLQKTRKHFNRFPQRYFLGEIVSDKGKTIIRGKFRFSPSYMRFFALFMIAITAFVIFVFKSSFPKIDGWICIMSLVILVYWIIAISCSFGGGMFFFKNEELAVIEFIRSIGKQEE